MKTCIKNAKIIIGDGSLIEKGSIVFDETGILDIGTGDFAADEVIDAVGKTVAPGFIDCHIHLGVAPYPYVKGMFGGADEITVGIRTCYQAQQMLREGVTTVRVVGTKYGADLSLRTLVASGEIKAPRIFGAGEVICSTAGHCCEMGTECDTVGEVLKAARTRIKQKADLIKMMPSSGVIGLGPPTTVQLSEDQIKAICQVGIDFDTPTSAHLLKNYPAMIQCIEAGLTTLEHGGLLDEKIADMMVEHGTWFIPTAVVTWNEARYLPDDEPMKAKSSECWQFERKAVSIAIQHGVKMAIGTDTGCPFDDPDHFTYSEEMCIFKECGMDPMDVIVCATKRGAELLRMEDKIGTLEVGKIADVIIIDGDPLQDMAVTRNIERTYRSGKLYYKD